MCQFRLSDGSICGEVDNLEFHAPDGEKNDVRGQPKKRTLRCKPHHRLEDGHEFPEERGYIPLLQEDIAYEIDNLGGVAAWKEHYKIKEKEVTE